MKEFGEYLRQERITRGITLEAIAHRTRIQTRYLFAIENGKFDKLPEPTYIKAFLKHYANCVGLDHKAILHRYDTLRKADASDVLSSDTRSQRRARQFKARRRRRMWQWVAVAGVVATVTVWQLLGSPFQEGDDAVSVVSPIASSRETPSAHQEVADNDDGPS